MFGLKPSARDKRNARLVTLLLIIGLGIYLYTFDPPQFGATDTDELLYKSLTDSLTADEQTELCDILREDYGRRIPNCDTVRNFAPYITHARQFLCDGTKPYCRLARELDTIFPTYVLQAGRPFAAAFGTLGRAPIELHGVNVLQADTATTVGAVEIQARYAAFSGQRLLIYDPNGALPDSIAIIGTKAALLDSIEAVLSR